MTRFAFMAGRSSGAPHCWLCGILVGLVLASVPLQAAYALDSPAEGSPGKITLQDGKLTVRVVGVPLRQVMKEVSRLSGAQVQWLSPEQEKPVSVKFSDVPFAEALSRILHEQNFLLLYAPTREGTMLAQIWISSREQSGRQPLRSPRPGLEGDTASSPTSNAVLQEEGRVDTLIQAALYEQEPVARLDALTQLGGYAQEDPRAKAILSQVAQSDHDQAMREAAVEMLENMKEMLKDMQ